jgi:hypothetical protein
MASELYSTALVTGAKTLLLRHVTLSGAERSAPPFSISFLIKANGFSPKSVVCFFGFYMGSGCERAMLCSSKCVLPARVGRHGGLCQHDINRDSASFVVKSWLLCSVVQFLLFINRPGASRVATIVRPIPTQLIVVTCKI